MAEYNFDKRSFSSADSYSAFVKYMNERAVSIGMTATNYVDSVGIDNFSTAADCLRCLITASGYEKLYDIWNKPSYDVVIKGENARVMTVTSTVVASEQSPILTGSYPVMGGKTGTLTSKGAFNLSVLVDVPDSDARLACVVLYANQKNGEPENRFEAARRAVNAALTKYYDKNYDNSNYNVCAGSAAVCEVPKFNARAYSKLDIPLLYGKNIDEPRMPASMTKIMTAMLTLDLCPDLYANIAVRDEDIAMLSSRFYDNDIKVGDVLTVRDMMYAMLLPSSNSAATILACYAGNKLLESINP